MAARVQTRVLERGDGGSAVTLSVLPGGLRVVTESVPSARSASVGIWVGVGSIDEQRGLSGASHFLEHLLFKGTRTRTGPEIAASIDEVGGELNAFTSHEYTCYYAHVLASTCEAAVDTVCDVVLDAVIAADDVDVERSVILEEIAMRDDDPEDTLGDSFAAALFAGHRIAEPVIGTVDTISRMTRTQVNGYYRRRYHPERMVVAVAGGVDHGDVVRWVRRAFAGRSVEGRRPVGPRVGTGRYKPRTGVLVVERDIEQVHLNIGVPALRRADTRRPALAVLTAALGGGMSSRLFRTIREEKGLAYSTYAATSAYADVGSFSVYAGCQPEHLGTVGGLIRAELESVAADGLEPAELQRVKGQLTGGFLLGLEDTESRMSRIGKNLLTRDRHRTVDEELAGIRAVDAEAVGALAAELLRGPLVGAVVGPYAHEQDLPAGLLEAVGASAAAGTTVRPRSGTVTSIPRARRERQQRDVG
nr:pitrilysin family protein [Nakamurella alba]